MQTAGTRVRTRDRALDLAVVLVLAVPVALVMLAVALATKLESPGPVLFRCTRVGRDGRPFAMVKFRKMHDGATGAALTSADDERFTRIGRFLSRTKLDELPQLWNVVRGEMRLVGPRPEDPRFVQCYPAEFAEILQVPPGITGPTQLEYAQEYALLETGDDAVYVSRVLPHKLESDLRYVRTRGLARDSWILARTAMLFAQLLAAGVAKGARRGVRASARPAPLAGIASLASLLMLVASTGV